MVAGRIGAGPIVAGPIVAGPTGGSSVAAPSSARAARRPSRMASWTVRGATQSPTRQQRRVAERPVQVVVGQAVAAVDQQRRPAGEKVSPGPHVDAVDRTPADRGDPGAQLAGHPGPLEPHVGVGQVAGAGQQGAGHGIRAHQGDRPAGGARQPFGHADPDRAADGVVDDHRAVRQQAGSLAGAGSGRRSTGGSLPAPG